LKNVNALSSSGGYAPLFTGLEGTSPLSPMYTPLLAGVALEK